MLSGRTPTVDEGAYMQAVADLGCIICRIYLHVYSPAEIHHVDGKTKLGCHFRILPLCARHHRITGKGYVSRADGKKAFEAKYMPEEDLIVCVHKAVEIEQLNNELTKPPLTIHYQEN
jgi:hypothetical protein